MPKIKISKDGKVTDAVTGNALPELEVDNLKELSSEISTVDKEAVFKEQLKDRFALEPEALKNINEIANNARREEKEKLYKDIETAQNNAKTFEVKAKELEGKMSEATAKITDLEKVRDKGGKPDDEAVKALKLELDLLKKKDQENLTLFENFKTDMQKAIETEKITAHRSLKIAEAGGKIIPELVQGATKEAIDLSYVAAVARYNEIVAAHTPPAGTTPAPVGTPSPVPAQSTAINTLRVSHGGVTQQMTAEQIVRLSPKQYEEYRTSILQAASGIQSR